MLNKVIGLSVVFILSLTIRTNGAASMDEPLATIVKSNQLLVRTDRDFIGGEICVYDGKRALLVSQKMKKRKVSIDFSEAMIGEYIVKVTKGKHQQEFHFFKK